MIACHVIHLALLDNILESLLFTGTKQATRKRSRTMGRSRQGSIGKIEMKVTSCDAFEEYMHVIFAAIIRVLGKTGSLVLLPASRFHQVTFNANDRNSMSLPCPHINV